MFLRYKDTLNTIINLKIKASKRAKEARFEEALDVGDVLVPVQDLVKNKNAFMKRASEDIKIFITLSALVFRIWSAVIFDHLKVKNCRQLSFEAVP